MNRANIGKAALRAAFVVRAKECDGFAQGARDVADHAGPTSGAKALTTFS